MLRELIKLAGGMLFLHGYVADPETARILARDTQTPNPKGVRGRRFDGSASADRNWRALVELSMLAAVFGGSFVCVALGALVLAGLLPQ